MLLPDVNVVLMGLRPELSDDAERVRNWLERHLTGNQVIGVSELVLSSVVRISTNPRLFDVPSSPLEAIEYVESVGNAPQALMLRPGPGHWAIFRELVTEHRLRENDVPDAYFAAMALETGAVFVTRDKGFRRFAGLRVIDPLDAS